MTGTAGRRRLGRGLEALLGPATTDEARAAGALRQVPVDTLRPNRFQPRHVIDEAALGELAESMRSSGLLQPVVVRPIENGNYELIAGERRWRAAQLLQWKEIGAVVRQVDDQTVLTLALIENLQRDALSPIDEARGYHRLIEEFGVSQAEVAGQVGRDRSTVSNALRLLKLPARVQQLVHAGTLSTGHARALLALDDPDAVDRVARLVVEQGLSVRAVEELTRRETGASRRRARRSRRQGSPEVRRVEDALRRRLQTDVLVTPRGKSSGRVTINFYSHDDLARILEIILGEPFNG